MQRKVTFILVGMVPLIAMAAGLWLAKGGSRWNAGWGRGELKASERAYYLGRLGRIADAWRDTARSAMRPGDGVVEDRAFTCLVVDTTGKRVWLESHGQPVPGYEVELPARMEWRLHRSTPESMTEMAPLSRFQVRGIYTRQLPLEHFFLDGLRGWREHLSFSFGPSGMHSGDYHVGSLPKTRFEWSSSARQDPKQERYGSMVVSEADYEQAKAQFGGDAPALPEPAVLRENWAAWVCIEKHLYQEIDRQVSLRGLELRDLGVTCGPDHTAASAELRASSGFLQSILRRESTSVQAYLQIDALGNDVWYAKSASHPRHSLVELPSLDL